MNRPTPQNRLATAYAALQQQLMSASRLKGASALYASLTPALRRNVYVSPPWEATQGLPASSVEDKQVTLIGASKGQPASLLEEAIALGLRDFGENKVQEAQVKWPELKARHPGVRLHLIGPLQSNKAAEAVALFEVIQTVDREKIAAALASEITRQQKSPLLLIQVNTGEEPQKAGVAPKGVAPLLAYCRSLGLEISGLMCVPPANQNPAPHFALMKKMADTLGLTELSMGMSQDFPTAIRLGATMVRVGTALFGERA